MSAKCPRNVREETAQQCGFFVFLKIRFDGEKKVGDNIHGQIGRLKLRGYCVNAGYMNGQTPFYLTADEADKVCKVIDRDVKRKQQCIERHEWRIESMTTVVRCGMITIRNDYDSEAVEESKRKIAEFQSKISDLKKIREKFTLTEK